MLSTLEDQVRPDHAALVLVDIQNDFVDADGWVARRQPPGFTGDTGVEAVVDRAALLLGAARRVGALVVHVRMIGDARYLSEAQRVIFQRNNGEAVPDCVLEGTWGADFPEPLTPAVGDREIVVDKHRYSAFIGTRLHQILRTHRIETLVIGGVATSGCVESTIRDGFMLDHHVVVPADACGDYEQVRHDQSLSKMDGSFGTVTDVDTVVAAWTVNAEGSL